MAKKASAKKSKWLKDLSSPVEEVILDTIDDIAKKGDITMVIPLLECFKSSDSGRIQQRINNTLIDVKDKKLGDELFKALADEEFSEIRAFIISVVWNASATLQGHLELLVKIGSEGSFEEQFEVVTALDNYLGEYNEEEIMNSLIDMREVIRARGEASELQQQILQKLNILERFD